MSGGDHLAHTNPASSRAMAVTTTLRLVLLASRRPNLPASAQQRGRGDHGGVEPDVSAIPQVTS
jgi:hypothetical protein